MVWSAAAASLTVITSVLSAADDAQVRNLENRVTALEQRKSANGMINPNGRPQVRDGADLFFTADFIYWVANESGLGFVVKNENNCNWVSSGKLKTPGFNWEPGFRVGIGYNLPHDGWDVYADWTWLIARANKHVSSDGGNLFPTFLNINEIDTHGNRVWKADAKWKTNLNMIDLELGRQFFVSKWLTLRPFMGLRNAWVNQHYNLSYQGVFNTYNSFVPDVTGILRGNHECKFWGIGLRTGLNTQWGLGCGFSAYGDLGLSLLFGRFHINEHENFCGGVSSSSSSSSVDFSNANMFRLKDKYTACRAITDLGAGLRWDHYFNRDRFHFRFQAGWEQHMFFSQNQFDRVVDDFQPGMTVTNQGDLSFNGLTLSTRFDF